MSLPCCANCASNIPARSTLSGIAEHLHRGTWTQVANRLSQAPAQPDHQTRLNSCQKYGRPLYDPFMDQRPGHCRWGRFLRRKRMKNMILSLVVALVCVDCANGAGLPEVTFEWFNLSTNQIWVTDVSGLPPEASPGRLMPSHTESQLDRSASVFSETVRIKDRITIKWKDNGKEGWPGGLKIPGSIPPGVAHQAEFQRAELGLPAKLKNAKIRFTYLGKDKWRVTRLK